MPNWNNAWCGILVFAVSSLCTAHQAPDATLWMQTSAEYRVLVEQVFSLAQERLPDALAAPPSLGAVENQTDAASKKPAVILDIDETVLDNGPFQALSIIRGQRGFDREAWNDWILRHNASALPGGLDYVRAARSLGIAVFYITNRTCSSRENCPQQDATIRNLTELGFPEVDDAKVLMKNEQPGWTSEKSSRRDEIARDYHIIQLIGDDLGDFIPGVREGNPKTRFDRVDQYRERFGHTWHLLPNPRYGSWKKALGSSPVSHLDPDRDQLCLGVYTPIGHIQGPGHASHCTGLTVNTRGVVTLVSTGKGGLGGYFVQDTEGDGNTATADGIFVIDRNNQSGVTTGDLIEIRAHTTERNGLTALEPRSLSAVTVLDRGLDVRPTPIRLPESFDGELERYEGMLVFIAQPMTVTGNYWLGDLGQLELASADDQGQPGRRYQPTHLAVSGSPEASRIQNENARRLLVLDDGKGFTPDPLPFISTPDENTTLRVGDQVTDILGILDYGEITLFSSGHRRFDYRVQATQPPTISPRNLRPNAPPENTRDTRITNVNVNNFFTNLGSGKCPKACENSRQVNCRGAINDAEFRRQKIKLATALSPLNADLYGFQEVQNNGFDDTGAIATLAKLLGDDIAFIRTRDGHIGCDTISVGLAYRETVQPVGNAFVLSTGPFSASQEGASQVALAQVFKHQATGERFTVVVTQFMSRLAPDHVTVDANSQDNNAQRYENLQRTHAAEYLAKWLEDLAGRIDPNIVIIGGFHAYSREDPLRVLERAGYTNRLKTGVNNQTPTYNYVHDGLSGAVDHVLVSASLVGKTAALAWPINADEPRFMDYRLRGPGTGYFYASPFRASDHDPVILDITWSESQ